MTKSCYADLRAYCDEIPLIDCHDHSVRNSPAYQDPIQVISLPLQSPQGKAYPPRVSARAVVLSNERENDQNTKGRSRADYHLLRPFNSRQFYFGSNTALMTPLCPGREVIRALPIFVLIIAPLFMMFRRT